MLAGDDCDEAWRCVAAASAADNAARLAPTAPQVATAPAPAPPPAACGNNTSAAAAARGRSRATAATAARSSASSSSGGDASKAARSAAARCCSGARPSRRVAAAAPAPDPPSSLHPPAKRSVEKSTEFMARHTVYVDSSLKSATHTTAQPTHKPETASAWSNGSSPRDRMEAAASRAEDAASCARYRTKGHVSTPSTSPAASQPPSTPHRRTASRV